MLELNFNMFKEDGGYKLTVAAVDDDQVVHEEELEFISGLRKNKAIIRKKTVTLNDKALTLGLNIFNDNNKVQGK